MMRAVRYSVYGNVDVLKYGHVDVPCVGSNEVLVKVYSSSINDFDWAKLKGIQLTRFIGTWNWFKPAHEILGADISGKVVSVGSNVDRFNVGDAVFGDMVESGWGGFAEYCSAKQDSLVLKSDAMTFKQAAALPEAGCLAFQAVHDIGNVKEGDKVLINGAGGGAGTLAIQIARAFGASHITGVDSQEKLETMRSVGADKVIDYRKEDYTQDKDNRSDVIIDMAMHRSVFDSARALNPGGTYVMVGGSLPKFFLGLLLSPWFALVHHKYIKMLPLQANKSLDSLNELFESGKIQPVIDKCYPLSQVAEALQYAQGDAKAKGKVIISIHDEDGQSIES